MVEHLPMRMVSIHVMDRNLINGSVPSMESYVGSFFASLVLLVYHM